MAVFFIKFSLLRGSGLKCKFIMDEKFNIPTFSLLRGSGLKSTVNPELKGYGAVLPLTREWIEIEIPQRSGGEARVLPLTREWIEIGEGSSLNGNAEVLPLTREWIEICINRNCRR